VAPARGLGDVLHFFISEEEQRGARERAVARNGGGAVSESGPRVCLLAAPERPVLCALAVDLAAALSAHHSGATLLAPFPRPACAPRASGVCWEFAEGIGGGQAALLRRFETLPVRSAALLLVPPDGLAELLEHPTARALDGLLLPIDTTARGSARALRWLIAAGNGIARMRIGALLIGAASAEQAESQGEDFAHRARRELGLEIQILGNLERDASSYRALLHGRSVVELDSSSRASISLREVATRLVRWHTAAAARVAAAS